MVDSSDRRSSRRGRNSSGRSTSGRGASGKSSAERGEFQEAVDRLEKAVQDLVGSATNEFSDRAAQFVDDLTSKLEREFDVGEDGTEYGSDYGSDYGDDYGTDVVYDDYTGEPVKRGRNRSRARDGQGSAARMQARRRERRRASQQRIRPRTARLYRDPKNAKIGGVCAGIANYYGMETWVVRCIAVTGLLFLGQIVFPAYWIAYFVMDKPPRNSRQERPERPSDHNSPAPELGPKLSPRHSLRNVQADLTEVELRLRRMESHVTSGQYELQRELNRIDTPDSQPGAGKEQQG